MSAEADRILTPDQVAEMFHLTPAWVQAAARDRRIPARKMGKYWRFDRDELLTWWEEGPGD